MAPRTARLVDPDALEVIDLMGPTVQILAADHLPDGPSVLRGTIPPGAVVLMHSHGDPETFHALAGEFDALTHDGDAASWVTVRPGGVFHVPSGAKHAFRNRSASRAEMLIVSTARIARFFREVGAAAGSPEAEQEFLRIADRYGYWNATPEENAAVGLTP
jgi:quercetin dioxygenase-like cupin family protein